MREKNDSGKQDGEREGIIADAAGKQIGVRTDMDKATNPYHVKQLKKDTEMNRFSQTLK